MRWKIYAPSGIQCVSILVFRIFEFVKIGGVVETGRASTENTLFSSGEASPAAPAKSQLHHIVSNPILEHGSKPNKMSD